MGWFSDHTSKSDRSISHQVSSEELSTKPADSSANGQTSTIDKPSSAGGSHENILNYDQLVMRCMGRLELAQRLLASFERRFPLELSQIEESLESGDLPAFVRQTHQLKGASANVSAPALHSILKRIEEAGRIEQLDKINAGLAELREAWSEFQQYKATNCVSDTTPPGQACDPNSGPCQNPEKSSCAY